MRLTELLQRRQCNEWAIVFASGIISKGGFPSNPMAIVK
jgi:hypothetical protein